MYPSRTGAGSAEVTAALAPPTVREARAYKGSLHRAEGCEGRRSTPRRPPHPALACGPPLPSIPITLTIIGGCLPGVAFPSFPPLGC